MLIKIMVLLPFNVIITDAYGKRISRSPLDHSALHSDGDLRMGFSLSEFRRQGINFAEIGLLGGPA